MEKTRRENIYVTKYSPHPCFGFYKIPGVDFGRRGIVDAHNVCARMRGAVVWKAMLRESAFCEQSRASFSWLLVLIECRI